MKASKLVFLSFFMAIRAFAAVELENSAAVRVSTPNAFAYYDPTGVTITNGGVNYLYLYLQGGGTPGEDQSCVQGDHIIAFRAALDGSGNPGAFVRVGRISPCLEDPTNTSVIASYEPGQVFQATVNGVTAYHMLADVSDTANFQTVWHGWSTDGYDWTWEVTGQQPPLPPGGIVENVHDIHDALAHTITDKPVANPFLWKDAATSDIFLLAPILSSTNAGVSNAQWWGFLNYWQGTFKVGEILVDWTTGSPQVKLLTNVTGGSYTFSSHLTNGQIPNGLLFPLIDHGVVKSLLYDATVGGYQLWGGLNAGSTHGGYDYNPSTVNCNISQTATCPLGEAACTVNGVPNQPGCPTADGSCVAPGATVDVFQYNTGAPGPGSAAGLDVGSGFNWWLVTRYSFGSTNYVFSSTRYLPSGYSVARLYPFRWNSSSGGRYLFSATNDANICSSLLFSTFYQMYVVQSKVVYQ